MSVITLTDVTKKFGNFTALDTISFDVKKGEVVGFVGANGAGKTTTISTILGFINATNGKISVFGQQIFPNGAHKTHSRIGYAAGDMQLPLRLTARQYLRFVMLQTKGNHAKRLAELEKRFEPVLDKKIKELSRGNKQKIALIAAFVTSPELVILDEPTSGLDPVMQEKFLELVRQEAKNGTTIFMSSHYLNEVADVCTRVILMRRGKVIEDISAKELLAKSGKQVRVVTSYKATKPPKGASDIEIVADEKFTTLSFSFKGEASELQRWIAAIKQLQDVEITEYNLESAFKGMYEDEERKS